MERGPNFPAGIDRTPDNYQHNIIWTFDKRVFIPCKLTPCGGRTGLVTLSAVMSVIKILNPILTQVKNRKQGSKDLDTPWFRARVFWMTQIMV